jgi:prevent-host-death family protein
MRSVGAFEAKTHLAALLDAVSAGEQITITRHGRPVALLVPPTGDPPGLRGRHHRLPAALQPGADPWGAVDCRAARSGTPMSAPPPADGREMVAGDFVLDVSLSCAWGFADEASEEAWAVLEILQAGRAHVPALWLWETASAWHDTLALARSHRLTSDDAAYLELALRGACPWPRATRPSRRRPGWRECPSCPAEARASMTLSARFRLATDLRSGC